MKNLFVLTLFAIVVTVPCYVEASSDIGSSFVNMFNRFKRLMSSGEAVKPNRYVEIDFGEGEPKPAMKIVGEQLLKAPIVRASRHEVPMPEAVRKDLELEFMGPAVLKREETKKLLKGSQYPGEDDDEDDDDHHYDDDDHSDDSYYDPDDEDSDEDDDFDDDYDHGPFGAAKKDEPSVLSMSRKLAELQGKKALDENKKEQVENDDDDDEDNDEDEASFARIHHLGSGEVVYHHYHHYGYRNGHHSHVYDEDDFKCPYNQNGVYINLHHCRRYYICRAGRKTIVACHHGFSYDTRSRRCLPDSISRC